jgi:transcriptional regulator with XRE-family HTH domain
MLSNESNSVASLCQATARGRMNSIAFMKAKVIQPTAESEALRLAFEESGKSQISVADDCGVTSAAVRQWLTGERPVPIHRAEALGRSVGIDPRLISRSFASQHPPGPTLAPEDELRSEITAVQMVLAAFASATAHHSPVEAAAISEAIQRRVPKPLRDQRFVSELLAALDGSV